MPARRVRGVIFRRGHGFIGRIEEGQIKGTAATVTIEATTTAQTTAATTATARHPTTIAAANAATTQLQQKHHPLQQDINRDVVSHCIVLCCLYARKSISMPTTSGTLQKASVRVCVCKHARAPRLRCSDVYTCVSVSYCKDAFDLRRATEFNHTHVKSRHA